jgi:uncharacterized protein (DUF433 family)
MTAVDLKLGVACPTRHILGHDARQELGGEANVSYAPPLAATLTGASVRQLAYWRRTTPTHGVLFAPEHGTRPRVLYSYQDIVALRMFVQLRGHLSLQKVRKVASYLLKHYPDTHLASHSIKAVPGGRTAVWVSPDGEYVDVIERPGQGGLKFVMDDIFRSFTTGTGQRVPDLAEPTQGVTIDPGVRGGFPVIEGTRIPFTVVAGLYADGMTSGEIAELYPAVTEADVVGAAQLAELVAENAHVKAAA